MHAKVLLRATLLIAIPTCRRPGMLREALDAVRLIRVPENVAASVVVIDNDPAGNARPVIGHLDSERLPVDYVHAPTRGLSSVRNRALDEAVERDVDTLVFLDDDEEPAPDWLVGLWNGLNRTNADLAGGPVLTRAPERSLVPGAAFVHQSIALSARVRRASRIIPAAIAKPVTITTNNWIARMSFVRRHGLRFNPCFNQSGVEDTDFYRQVNQAGGRTTWIARAAVKETLPPARLRYEYLFRRRFDSGVVRTGTVAVRHGVWVAACRFTPGACLMLVSGSLLLLAAPITALFTPPMALGHFGRGSGYFAGLLGARSEHYRTTTGY